MSTKLKKKKAKNNPKVRTISTHPAPIHWSLSNEDEYIDLPNDHLILGAAGLWAATQGSSELLDVDIPCRFADRGCTATFKDLLTADTHARLDHGETSRARNSGPPGPPRPSSHFKHRNQV